MKPFIFLLLSAVAATAAENLAVLPSASGAQAPGAMLETWLKQQAYAAFDRRHEAFEKLKSQAECRAWQEERRAFFLKQIGVAFARGEGVTITADSLFGTTGIGAGVPSGVAIGVGATTSVGDASATTFGSSVDPGPAAGELHAARTRLIAIAMTTRVKALESPRRPWRCRRSARTRSRSR